ncbi:MAG TPA: putative sulfate exporter family transporter [Acidimicrobiales bacterium]
MTTQSERDCAPRFTPLSKNVVHSTLRVLPGLSLATVIGVAATGIAHFLPIVGAPVIAIIIGILVALARPASSSLRPGLHVASKLVLQVSIVLLGTGLSLREVASTGLSSLPVLLGTLVIALVAAWFVGRRLGVVGDVRTLIGVGTAICGASAIAATDAVIDAPEQDVAYAVATIFTFNVVAVLTFPLLGHALHLSQHSFGLLAGTAVNDVSSVVATSSVYGHAASSYAIIVKLSRTLMIIPIALGLAFWKTRQEGKREERAGQIFTLARLAKIFPWFIAWFVGAVLLNSAGIFSHTVSHDLANVAQIFIAIALAAIGLSTRLRDIHRAGFRPLALGAVLWVVVTLASLLLQLATGSI